MARRANTTEAGTGATPALIRWGAVFGGMVIGMSLLILLTALWVAIGIGTQVEGVQANLNWFIAGSAIIAMFVGGLLAGWLSGVPGSGPGFFNGLTVWGLILIGSIVIGAPGAMQIFGADAAALEAMNGLEAGNAMWAGFAALLIGALAAGIGGMLGGMMTHPAFVYAAPHATGYREEATTTPPGTVPPPGDEERTIRMPEEERGGRRG